MALRNHHRLVRQNVRLVKQLHPQLPRTDLNALRELTAALNLSISRGEIIFIERKWYVTHAGLLRVALQKRCRGIQTELQALQSDASVGKWIFKATVYKTSDSKGFVGYGDADPSNISPIVRGAEMRVAETCACESCIAKSLRYRFVLGRRNRLVSFILTDLPTETKPAKNGNGNGNGAHVHSSTASPTRSALPF